LFKPQIEIYCSKVSKAKFLHQTRIYNLLTLNLGTEYTWSCLEINSLLRSEIGLNESKETVFFK